jgi:hypothetical protein
MSSPVRATMFRSALACVALALVVLPAGAGASRWALQTDPDLGFRYSYPAEVFSPIENDGKPYFHYFASPSSEAKFLVGGWNNGKGQSPEGLKRWLIENVGGYDETTYRPRGRSWFVLSGYRGDSIYYEKVMFSCGGSLVNVFAITYPVDQRNIFDPIVERMEDTFRPGSRCSS